MGYALYNASREDLFPQVEEIATSYFTMDTATPETALGWYRKNPHTIVIAVNAKGVQGYIDFVPLTDAAKEAIEHRDLDEEDITADCILDMTNIHTCRAIYFAGMAVRKCPSIGGARCVGALLVGALHVIHTVFATAPLEVIYANPTTFTGNRIARHVGFTPISYRKIKMGGMDLYMLPMDATQKQRMHDFQTRYAPLVKSMNWVTS
jgi:hypothetical protein